MTRNLYCIESQTTVSRGCCCCKWTSKEKYPTLCDEKCDRFDYIVEKLAIKRVPVIDFATEEDLLETNTACSCSKRARSIDEINRKSRITLASYYTSVSPSSAKVLSQISKSKETEQKYRARSPPTTHKSAHDKEMVSQILNNFTSLYTLDDGKRIPKDPETLGNSYCPGGVQSPATQKKIISDKSSPLEYSSLPHKQQQFPFAFRAQKKQQVYAQVHQTEKKSKITDLGMTKEIRDTIDALGAAQPNLRTNIVQMTKLKKTPANKKEEPTTYHEIVEEESRELRCIALDKDVKLVLHRCCDQNSHSHKSTVLTKPNNYVNKQVSAPKPVLTVPMENLVFTRDMFECDSMYLEDIPETESMPIVLEEENNVAVLPSKFSFGDVGTSTELQSIEKATEKALNFTKNACSEKKPITNTSNQGGDDLIMDINKGQNLKWKIIIKHHDDEEDIN